MVAIDMHINSNIRNSHTVGDVRTGVVKHAISYHNLVAFNDALNFFFIVKADIVYLNVVHLNGLRVMNKIHV